MIADLRPRTARHRSSRPASGSRIRLPWFPPTTVRRRANAPQLLTVPTCPSGSRAQRSRPGSGSRCCRRRLGSSRDVWCLLSPCGWQSKPPPKPTVVTSRGGDRLRRAGFRAAIIEQLDNCRHWSQYDHSGQGHADHGASTSACRPDQLPELEAQPVTYAIMLGCVRLRDRSQRLAVCLAAFEVPWAMGQVHPGIDSCKDEWEVGYEQLQATVLVLLDHVTGDPELAPVAESFPLSGLPWARNPDASTTPLRTGSRSAGRAGERSRVAHGIDELLGASPSTSWSFLMTKKRRRSSVPSSSWIRRTNSFPCASSQVLA